MPLKHHEKPIKIKLIFEGIQLCYETFPSKVVWLFRNTKNCLAAICHFIHVSNAYVFFRSARPKQSCFRNPTKNAGQFLQWRIDKICVCKRIRKRYYYFWVTSNHLWSKQHFLRQLGQSVWLCPHIFFHLHPIIKCGQSQTDWQRILNLSKH